MDLSATVWTSRTTSGLDKTGNSVGKGRLTSINTTLMAERRHIWCKRLQNGEKRRPISAYAHGSRNMAETQWV